MHRIIEGIQFWLKSLGERSAESAESQQILASNMETVVEKLGMLEDAMVTLTSKVGQLYDSVNDLNSRLGLYLIEQQRKENALKVLQSEVREIQRKAI
jgi:hypothetical protein